MSDLSIKEKWLVLHIKQLKDKVERLQAVVDRLADAKPFARLVSGDYQYVLELEARIEYAANHATEDKS